MQRTRKKLRELLVRTKNNAHLPRSPRAWAALGREVLRKRQAFPEGGTWLRAWKLLARRKWVARMQDWLSRRSRRRGARWPRVQQLAPKRQAARRPTAWVRLGRDPQ